MANRRGAEGAREEPSANSVVRGLRKFSAVI